MKFFYGNLVYITFVTGSANRSHILNIGRNLDVLYGTSYTKYGLASMHAPSIHDIPVATSLHRITVCELCSYIFTTYYSTVY